MMIGGNVFLDLVPATELSQHGVSGEPVTMKHQYPAVWIVHMFFYIGTGFGLVRAVMLIKRCSSVCWRGVYYLVV